MKSNLKVVVENVHSDFTDFVTDVEHDYVVKDTLLFSCGQMLRSFEKFINPHKELIHPNFRMY